MDQCCLQSIVSAMQGAAEDETEALLRGDGSLGLFHLAKAPITAFGQEYVYFCASIEMLFYRKCQSHDVAVSTTSCSLQMFAQSEVILDTSYSFPLHERQFVWDGASKPEEEARLKIDIRWIQTRPC